MTITEAPDSLYLREDLGHDQTDSEARTAPVAFTPASTR